MKSNSIYAKQKHLHYVNAMTSKNLIFLNRSFYTQHRKDLRKSRKMALEAEEKKDIDKKPEGLDQALKFYPPEKNILDVDNKKIDLSVIEKKDSNCRTRL